MERRLPLVVVVASLVSWGCDKGAAIAPGELDTGAVFTPEVEAQIVDGQFSSLSLERVADIEIAPPESAAAATSDFLRHFGAMHLPHWNQVVGRTLRREQLGPCRAPALALPFAGELPPTASTLARVLYGPSYMVQVCERNVREPVAVVRVPAKLELLQLRHDADSLVTYAGVLFVAPPIAAGASTALDPIEAATFASRVSSARVREVPVLQSRPFAEYAFRGDWRIVLEGSRKFQAQSGEAVDADTLFVGLDDRGERAAFVVRRDVQTAERTAILPDPDQAARRPDLVLRIGPHGTSAKVRVRGRLP